jgi:predicted metal-binding membrane protein
MFWAQARAGSRALTIAVAGLVLAAWLAIVTWSVSPYSRYLHHGSFEELPVAAPAAAAIFVGGWTLMIVAMMLPTTYPVLALFRGVIRQRDDRALLLSLCMAWMLMLATVMAVEKNVAWGPEISRPLGASLLGSAGLAVYL